MVPLQSLAATYAKSGAAKSGQTDSLASAAAYHSWTIDSHTALRSILLPQSYEVLPAKSRHLLMLMSALHRAWMASAVLISALSSRLKSSSLGHKPRAWAPLLTAACNTSQYPQCMSTGCQQHNSLEHERVGLSALLVLPFSWSRSCLRASSSQAEIAKWPPKMSMFWSFGRASWRQCFMVVFLAQTWGSVQRQRSSCEAPTSENMVDRDLWQQNNCYRSKRWANIRRRRSCLLSNASSWDDVWCCENTRTFVYKKVVSED